MLKSRKYINIYNIKSVKCEYLCIHALINMYYIYIYIMYQMYDIKYYKITSKTNVFVFVSHS